MVGFSLKRDKHAEGSYVKVTPCSGRRHIGWLHLRLWSGSLVEGRPPLTGRTLVEGSRLALYMEL